MLIGNAGPGNNNNVDVIDNSSVAPIEKIISTTHVAESSPTLKELIDNDSFLLDAGLLDNCDYHADTNKNKKNAPNKNDNHHKSIRFNTFSRLKEQVSNKMKTMKIKQVILI